ncbi:MAG: acyltransferase [Lachnospiraceae bacterium]|nr:acyltransferase [Lachnospiraceae bacterium]
MRWIYLVYPALVLIMCFGAKFAGFRKSQWNEEFLSLKQTKAVQGFLAILILMHHVSQKVSAEWIPQRVQKPGLEIFVEAGYLFVALFFFYSGYGLFKSYRTKENYFEGFFIKRVLPIIIVYYLSNCIFFIGRLIVGERPDGISTVLYILGLRLANSNSWYCITIIILYMVYALVFKALCKDKSGKKENAAILLMVLVVVIYQLVCCMAGHGVFVFQGEWWFNSVQLFPVGLVVAKYEEKLIKNFKKYYYVYLPISMVLSVLASEIMMYAKNTFSYYGENNPNNTFMQVIELRLICLVAQIIATLAVLWFVLLVTMKIEFGNKILGFMSKITLEFYLIHALFIEIFCYTFYGIKEVFYIREPILFLLSVAIPSVPCALILKKLTQIIMKPIINNYRNKSKEA